MPNHHAQPKWFPDDLSAVEKNGVEVIMLDPIYETEYSLYVRNTNLDQTFSTSGLVAKFYGSEGLVKTVTLPPTEVCTPTWSDQGTGSGACTYHDTPLDNFWYKYSDGNIESEEFLRLACIDHTAGGGGDGASAVLHECQRYMDATAWGHLSTVTSCPASDDICDGDGKDTWQCR